jgi:hypothetical protein
MAARKFGAEERDLDDVAQIQEQQEQLNRLRRQSSAAYGNGAAAGRFASADIMAIDLEAQLASHDGVHPPAMNHPSDVLTIRRFVFDWLGFYSFALRLCTEEQMHV